MRRTTFRIPSGPSAQPPSTPRTSGRRCASPTEIPRFRSCMTSTWASPIPTRPTSGCTPATRHGKASTTDFSGSGGGMPPDDSAIYARQRGCYYGTCGDFQKTPETAAHVFGAPAVASGGIQRFRHSHGKGAGAGRGHGAQGSGEDLRNRSAQNGPQPGAADPGYRG